MPSDQLIKVLKWLSNQVNHGYTRQYKRILVVCLRFLDPTRIVFDTRFVKVGFSVENKSLDRDEDLEHSGLIWVPFLVSFSEPGVEKTETDRAVGVEVGVESEPE